MSEGIAAGDSAVLVIRVWHEPETAEGFRARILYGDTSGTGEPTMSRAASNPDDVLAAVRRWLGEHS